MLPVLILLALLAAFCLLMFKFYRQKKNEFKQEKENLSIKLGQLKEEDKKLGKKINQFEREISLLFTFYDTARLVSPLFEKKKVISTLIEGLVSLDEVEKASLFDPDMPNCHRFLIGKDQGSLFISTRSFFVLRLGPIFAKLLAVCFEKLKLYRQLQELSLYDYLTDAYNRRHFEQRMEEEFLRAKNLKQKISFLMLDIDNFKMVNDTYGHPIGDIILKKCTELIKENIRQIDFAGRLGGEEFGVLLLDTDKAGAIMVAERICSRISQEKIKTFDELLSVTVSVGLATYPTNTIHMDFLAEIADKALFRAKASGKDRVCWF